MIGCVCDQQVWSQILVRTLAVGAGVGAAVRFGAGAGGTGAAVAGMTRAGNLIADSGGMRRTKGSAAGAGAGTAPVRAMPGKAPSAAWLSRTCFGKMPPGGGGGGAGGG